MARKLAKKNTKVQKVIKKAKPVVAGQSAVTAQTATTTVPVMTGTYTEAVGRRKTASARVRLYHNGGDFVVNGKAAGQYFAGVINAPLLYNRAFTLTETQNTMGVSVKVAGAGLQAQLGAVVHGIARALIKFNPELRTILKANDLLSRDDRMKETRKVGHGGKARRKRQSPKR